MLAIWSFINNFFVIIVVIIIILLLFLHVDVCRWRQSNIMPRIETDLKLDFKDVLFRPKRSTIRSRADVSETWKGARSDVSGAGYYRWLWTSISLYLRNGAKQGYSYNGRLMGTVRSFVRSFGNFGGENGTPL